LAEYQAPDIDPGVDESIREYIDRKKAAMSDQWY
jgi:trimethylamine:corrinoid methyltransferase-like protein